jgi:hypothetical protein
MYLFIKFLHYKIITYSCIMCEIKRQQTRFSLVLETHNSKGNQGYGIMPGLEEILQSI